MAAEVIARRKIEPRQKPHVRAQHHGLPFLQRLQQHVFGLLRAGSAHLHNAHTGAPAKSVEVLQVAAPADEHRRLAAELHLPVDEADARAEAEQHLLGKRVSA